MNHTHFTIFKNKFKKADNQPDYKISGKDEKGNFIDIGACWIKDGKNGDKFMSCKFTENPAPVLSDVDKENIRLAREQENTKPEIEASKISF